MSLTQNFESSKSTTETDHFGKVLRALRLNANISLRELAIKTGIHPVQLGEFERGLRDAFETGEWIELMDAIPGFVDAHRDWKSRQPPKLPPPPLPTQPDYKLLLEELLAAIHRDGGHFTKLAGLMTSLQEAHKKVEATYPSRRR